jgi:hypothetical protein
MKFADGTSQTFLLANPGASVALRDRNGVVEYLGSQGRRGLELLAERFAFS